MTCPCWRTSKYMLASTIKSQSKPIKGCEINYGSSEVLVCLLLFDTQMTDDNKSQIARALENTPITSAHSLITREDVFLFRQRPSSGLGQQSFVWLLFKALYIEEEFLSASLSMWTGLPSFLESNKRLRRIKEVTLTWTWPTTKKRVIYQIVE